MPNWCNNGVTIIGPAHKIAALWAAATKDEDAGLLNAMVPMPEGLRGTVKGTGEETQTVEHDGHTNWYDWCVDRWSTKWDVGVEGLSYQDMGDGRAQITGGFDSAWAPPINAFQTYSNDNPDVALELKYFEPGMAFFGVWDTEGGDAYYDNVGGLLEVTEEEDAVIYELLEYFDVWQWFNEDEEDAEETAPAEQ